MVVIRLRLLRSKLKEHIYSYTDESGQDTGGEIFLVSVVLVDKQRDELRNRLRAIEKMSGKGVKKWTKATVKQRIGYIEELARDSSFIDTIYFAHYENTRSYVDLTILTTAKAILNKAKDKRPYEAHVHLDGMRKSEQGAFTAGLRKLHIKLRMARGLSDQSDEFIRLADAIAGFVRDSIEGQSKMGKLYKMLQKKSILTTI